MKFSIGIDLGTTNCALAYVALADPTATTRVLPIPQSESAGRQSERDSLPSFLFYPGISEDPAGGWIAGAHARQMAGDRPGSVAHSAKSWLCHHTVDRAQRILPWGSEAVPSAAKISPVEASARLLKHLCEAWNKAFPNAPFHDQQITVTVPASFDTVAQKLTLQAAAEAGLPESVRLLEEPQAAFYRWLENHPAPDAMRDVLPELASGPQHVLVIDIGGGTSDFSLFELRLAEDDAPPTIQRSAVSDHILLGGDNIDLALAHLVESRFSPGGEGRQLGPKQWNYLVARCRNLKERALAETDEDAHAEYNLSVPGSGSGLIAGTLSAKVSRAEIEKLLFDGFFPKSEKNAFPIRTRAALRELGLPYASDGAVTRHLAAFLNGRPKIDAVLFNGGTTAPQKLRQRLLAQIAYWQAGNPPALLDNPEPGLAVARGAAHAGAIPHRSHGLSIAAGAARAVYLEVGSDSPPGKSLVCLLPRGTQPGVEIVLPEPVLQLQLNRRVEFQPWYSTRHEGDTAGAVIPLDPTEFHPLPALQTTAELAGRESVTVQLHSQLNAVGLLKVACESPELGLSWPLEFDLQSLPQGDEAKPTAAHPAASLSTIDPELFARATKRITGLLSRPFDRRDPVKPTPLIASLEKILGQAKHDWDGALVRGLWPALDETFDCRALSVDHEETWLNVAGFLLRPGYGAPGDAARMDRLWRLHASGLAFPKKGVRIQLYVLWRRVAGGLDRPRQTALIAPELERLRESANPPADLVRLAGSMERLELDLKRDLASLFIERGAALARSGKHAADYFAALTNLLTRIPLHTGPENLLPAELVETAFEALKTIEWTGPNGGELIKLFLRAARLTGDRQLDVSASLRRQLEAKLEKAGLASTKLQPLRQVMPVSESDRAQSFGESLPAGLSLGG